MPGCSGVGAAARFSDFIPVAGQLDDAIVMALVLRVVLQSGGEDLLREHWPGPDMSFEVMRRLTFGQRPESVGA